MAQEHQPIPPRKRPARRTVRPGRVRGRTRWIAAAAALLTAGGIALIAAGCAASRSGPPQPPSSAAGTIPPAGAVLGAASPSDSSPSHDAAAGSSSGVVGSSAVGVASNPAASSGADPAPPTASTFAPSPRSAVGSTPASTSRRTGRPPATSRTAPIRATTTSPSSAVTGPVLPSSRPVRLTVPAIGVDTTLLTLGLNPDGTVQVPPLDDPHSKAGWYRGSPTPGTLGPAVILGHIDSAEYGPGVFYHLGDLRPGDHADVTLADGTVAVFRIDAVRSYPKADFPTLQVYGNIDYAGLRLITCGGAFDYSERSYVDNIVAFASLVSSHHA